MYDSDDEQGDPNEKDQRSYLNKDQTARTTSNQVNELLNSNKDNTDSDNSENEVNEPLQKKLKIIKTLLPPCPNSCRKKCFETISSQQRELIFQAFNAMGFSERRLFVDAYVTQIEKVYQSSSTKRKFTQVYTLQLCPQATKQIVCKTMFLHTLGFKTDGMITSHFSSKSNNSGLTKTKDGRGETISQIRKTNKLELCQTIKDHISTFNPVVSHYKLENSPNRRYLSCDVTINEMWKDYNLKHNKISYPTYWKIFNNENIGFDTPSQDKCPSCEHYIQHKTEFSTNDEPHATEICEICKQREEHHVKYIAARKEYKLDKNVTGTPILMYTP